MSDGVRQTIDGVVQTDTGVAQTVLDTGPTVYEDFSAGDLSNYEGTTSPYSASTTQAKVGTYSLKTESADFDEIYRVDDKAGPSRGETFEWFYYLDGSASEHSFVLLFAVNPSDSGDHYYARVRHSSGNLDIWRRDGGSTTTLANSGFSRFGYTGMWNRVTIDFGETTSSDITMTVTSSGGDEMGSVTATDTTYDSGTFGWSLDHSNTGDILYVDALREEGP